MPYSSSIRQMRKSRGLKSFQLADRLQVSAARVSVLEKDEARGAVTLKMMQRAAQALGCRFEYRLVPQEKVVNETLGVSRSVKNNVSGDEIIEKVKPRYRVVVD